jgi:hypothetical protein
MACVRGGVSASPGSGSPARNPDVLLRRRRRRKRTLECGASGWAVASGGKRQYGTERNVGALCFGFALPYSSEAAPRRLCLSLSGPATCHLPRFLYYASTFVPPLYCGHTLLPIVIKDQPGPGSCVLLLLWEVSHIQAQHPRNHAACSQVTGSSKQGAVQANASQI